MELPPRDTVLDPDWLTRFQAEHGALAFADLLRRAAETYGGAVSPIAATLLVPPYTWRLMKLVGIDVRRTLPHRLLVSSWSPSSAGPARHRRDVGDGEWLSDKRDELAAKRGEAPPPDLPFPDVRQLRLLDPIDSAWLAHTDGIWGCAVSPDGRYVASASRDRTLAVWNIATGTLVSRVTTDHGDVRDCLFTPDGKRVVSVHQDGRVSVWSVHPLEEVFTEDTPAPIGKHRWRRIAISSDSTRLAIANWRGEIDIWETGSWKRRATLHIESESDLLAIALPSSTECVVASRGSAAAVTVWNVDERRLTADYRIEMAANRFDTAAVLPDHRLLVASGFDRTFVWKFGKAEPIASVPRGIAGRGLAVSPDGSAVAFADTRRYVTVRTLPALTETVRWYLPDLGCADLSCAVAFSPENSRLVVAGWEGVIRSILLPPRRLNADVLVASLKALSGSSPADG